MSDRFLIRKKFIRFFLTTFIFIGFIFLSQKYLYVNAASPNDPTNLGPSNLVDGSTTSTTNPTLTFDLSDPDAGDLMSYYIEISTSSDFSSLVIEYFSGQGSQGSKSFTVGQAAGGGFYLVGNEGQTLEEDSYYWRVTALDSFFGSGGPTTANGGSVAFAVSVGSFPDTPSSLGPSNLIDGSYTTDGTPTLEFTLSDDDVGDTVKYQIQIDDTSNFSSPIIDYTSALAAQGVASFTAGQVESGGSYTTGNPDQVLSNDNYYWRVKAIDSSDKESSYIDANSGGIAFRVDTTPPNVPSGLAPDTNPTTSGTPTWTWSESADSDPISSSENDTTDTDFNDGTNFQTNIIGSGISGSVQLELSEDKVWDSQKTVVTEDDVTDDFILEDSSGNLYWAFVSIDNNAYLYRSTDDGVTWTSQKTVTTGSYLYTVYLLEDSLGNLYWSFGGFDNNAYLYRSTDGGVTWTSQETVTTGASGSRVVADHLLEDSSGNLYWSFVSFNTDAYLYRSTDGGVTWTSQETVNTGSWLETDFLFEDSSGNLYWSFGGADNNAYLYRSTDSGATWSSHETVATSGDMNDDYLFEDSSGNLYWSFVNGFDDDSAYLYRSTDDGVTWTSQETITAEGQVRTTHLFEDSSGNLYWSFGIEANKAHLYLSTDSGVTWTSQKTVDTGDDVYDSYLFEDSSGNLYWSFVSYDDNAYIYSSIDEGSTWSSMETVETSGWAQTTYLFEDSSDNLYWSFGARDNAYLYTLVDAYYSSGTFTSQVFNTGQQPSYTTLEFSDTEPTNSEVKYQLRSASTEAGVSSATWYGPTGTGDYYNSSGTNIHSTHDDDQYIQYKAIFSSSGRVNTSTVDNLTINYSYDSYLEGSEATSYTIQWCGNDSFTGCSSNTDTSFTTAFTHSTTLTDGTWYLRVKGVDDAGNESAYSSSSPVVVNAVSTPDDFEIREPDSKSYISEKRPEFSWTVDSSASTYNISVDNSDDGDFEVTGISASGSGKEETDRYKLEYKDDKIYFETKSSDEWGDSDNDGELKEGEREITIIATDGSSNTASKSKKFYVDLSSPNVEIEEFGGESYEDDISTSNTSPTIKVKVIDELNGDPDSVASGPDSGEIAIKKKGILGLYSTVISEQFDLDKIKWLDSGLEVDSNKRNDNDKYGTHTLSIDDSLSNGDYKIIVTSQDNAGNESEEEFKFTVKAPLFTGGIEEVGDPEVTVTGEGEGEELEKEEVRTYEVDVLIVDQNGDPLSGSAVDLGSEKYSVDENGQALIEGVEEGSYSLKVSYNGQTREEEVVLSGDVKRQRIEIVVPITKDDDLSNVAAGTKEFIENNQSVVATVSTAAITAAAVSSMFIPSSGLNIAQVSQYTGLFTEIDSIRTIPLLVTGFLRKKKNPWGVVYDAKNKQPLDPVIVTLTSADGQEHQSVTDMYGRYEFLVDPGTYKVDVKKTAYKFPSKNISGTDLVYSNVLTDTKIEVGANQKVQFNIPMDRVKEDWNQLEKMRMGIRGNKKYLNIIGTVSFWAGLLWSLIAIVLNPITVNFLLFGLFAGVLAFRVIRDRTRKWGVIKGQDGNPLRGLVIKLQNAKHPQMSPDTVVTDEQGRYNFLVEKGSYKLVIESKNYESDVIRIDESFGSIGFDLRF